MKYSGGCLCGSVRYECDAQPVIQGNCHCKDCQKATGSAFAPTFFVPEEAITINGEVKYYSNKGGSGKTVKRGFCPSCGSQLFGKPEIMPGLIAVRAGTLDDTQAFQPKVNIFTRHAAPWDYMDPALAKFEEMPPR
ncbi:MAG: GFA family protein [Gammaproteobacteria bacterium]